jgi:Fe-Mn family superoxide dismutase
METTKLYTLPELPYGYKDLQPYISEQQLMIHHQKHHQAYVNGANAIVEKLEKAKKEGTDLDVKPILKELSFHLGGHELHSTFWMNMAPAGKGGGGKPVGKLADAIVSDFGNLDRFKKQFTQAAVTVEGSG